MPLAFVCSFVRMDEATFPPADMPRNVSRWPNPLGAFLDASAQANDLTCSPGLVERFQAPWRRGEPLPLAAAWQQVPMPWRAPARAPSM
jgi:hypothetical protein